jgi:predicted O-linked N-acetylglucosamine transferase (SPINDLY family)
MSSAQGRKLRIGYVSPDFREHPVGRFMLPLMAHHDLAAFEIYCYTDVASPDAITEQLKTGADVWRSTAGLSDEQLAQLIRSDQIDVLVDLAMHLKGGRLLAFARRPAPVQITYLAYCSTTGLETMHYRITDPHLDPPGADESVYSEKTLRLPHAYWCYPAPENSPVVGPLPATTAGHVTFGCLNNFSKVTPQMLTVWGGLLKSIPSSRLILHSHEGSHRQSVIDQFTRDGIEPGRLQFVGFNRLVPYLELYNQIDIALDPYPYGGGTTTCDALWMGVPVVSLAGATAVSRAGKSILTNVGLSEWVADSPEKYVELATTLANDLPLLADLRNGLRNRLQESPLMKAAEFARDIEAIYAQAYHERLALQP